MKGRHGRALLVVCLLTVLTRILPAQGAADRRALAMFRDSLERTTDSVTLASIGSKLSDYARTVRRDDALLHLRLGFVNLRLGDVIGEGKFFDVAGKEFETATTQKPDWPYAWYGLGLSQLGDIETQSFAVRELNVMMGKDQLTKPARTFAKSVTIDPEFPDGFDDFVNTAIRHRVDGRLQVALKTLRMLGESPAGHSPDVLLMRARIEREAGIVDSGLIALDELTRREPRNAAAQFELARTRFVAGTLDGTTPFYLGLSIADSATTALYRRDLSKVLPDTLMRKFDAAKSDGRVSLLRKFFDARDGDDMRSPGERLREHYRRVDFAYRHFVHEMPFPLVQRTHPTSLEYDDRGVIFVRQGPPDEKADLGLVGMPPNESWRYRRNGRQDLLFHFVVRDGDPGYHMVESVLDILALSGQAKLAMRAEPARMSQTTVDTWGAGLVAQTAQELLKSRLDLDPIYGKMLDEGKTGAIKLQATEREEGRTSIVIGTQTDGFALGFELTLQAKIDVLGVGVDEEGSQMQVVFAIPGGAVAAKFLTRGVVYPVHIRASVMHPDGSLAATIDTVRPFYAATPLLLEQYLLGRQPIHVPPGAYDVKVVLEVDGRGVITPKQRVIVAEPAAPAIELSDLALGVRTVKLPWITPRADTAWVNPLYEFKAAEPMQLYFEVMGVPPGKTYKTEISVIRISGETTLRGAAKFVQGNGTEMMRFGIEKIHTGGADPVHREVSLERLNPGRYLMEIKVTGEAGKTATRSREFVIVK